MSAILTTARLTFKDAPTRSKAIEAFRNIIAYTTPKEPEVLQYVCALPVNDSLGTAIYMIEEYANQAASDAHLTTPPVQDLINLFTTGDVLAAPPDVHNCAVKHKNVSATSLAVSSNPVIVLLHTTWALSIDGVRNSVESINSVTVVDDGQTGGVRAELVFDNWESWEAFVKSETGKTALRGAESIVELRVLDGFLAREDRSKL